MALIAFEYFMVDSYEIENERQQDLRLKLRASQRSERHAGRSAPVRKKAHEMHAERTMAQHWPQGLCTGCLSLQREAIQFKVREVRG